MRAPAYVLIIIHQAGGFYKEGWTNMVPIIILLALAVFGGLYLYLTSREPTQFSREELAEAKSQVERIAQGISSASSGKPFEHTAIDKNTDRVADGNGKGHADNGKAGSFNNRMRAFEQLKHLFPIDIEQEGTLFLLDKLGKVAIDDTNFNIHNISQLPSASFPILHELNRKDSSATDVARAIESDWDLAARIIKLSNSAFYGMGEEVTDIHRAITLLGFETVRSLIFLSGMINGLEHLGGPIQAKAVFTHCLSTSCVVPYFSTGIKPLGVNLITTAGLFHDVGKLLCARISPVKIDSTLHGMSTQKDFDKSQLENYGISHYLMTAILLDLWHFPMKLTTLITELALNSENMSMEAATLKKASTFVASLGFDSSGTEKEDAEFMFQISPRQKEEAAELIRARLSSYGMFV